MKRASFFKWFSAVLAATFLFSPAAQAVLTTYAEVSCRASSDLPDGNNHDSSKLSIRSDELRGEKSWIRFDIRSLDIDSMTACSLRLTQNNDKAGIQYFHVSAVKDDYTVNIGWAERELTWNNAPGNDSSDHGALDPLATTLIGQIDCTDGLAGNQYFIDVLAILQADTDGIVQFILHQSSSLLNMSTWDHPSGPEYRPALVYVPEPMTLTLIGLGGLIGLRKSRLHLN